MSEKSSMGTWAEREIEIAYKREREDAPDDEWGYGCACYDSAYKAFKSLLKDGHTGMSIGFTKNILNRLIDGKPLTPIEDTDDAWSDCVDERDEYTSYQCKRQSSLFKNVYADGSVNYLDVGRCFCIDVDDLDNPYTTGIVLDIIHEMFPITMPYSPPSARIRVCCETFLTDAANGGYDTRGVLFAIMPDGERVEINRFFDGSGGGWKEISKSEYEEKRRRRIDR